MPILDRKVITDRKINSFQILLNEPVYLLGFTKGIWLRFCFFCFFRSKCDSKLDVEVEKKDHHQTNQQTKNKSKFQHG